MTFYLTKSSSNLLKLISALAVLVHHYCQMSPVYTSQNVAIFTHILLGPIGVAVFFFLSGYGLMESERKSKLGLGEFARRRFMKMYLPVLLVTALWLGFIALSPPEILDVSGAHTWLWNLLIGFCDPTFWFIKALIMLYGLFYVFCVLYRVNRFAGIGVLLAGTAAVAAILYYMITEVFSVSVPLFTLGVLVSLRNGKRDLLVEAVDYLMVVELIFCIGTDYQPAPYIFAINSSVILLLMVIFSLRRIEIKVPAAIGILSFDIYLVHFKPLMHSHFTGLGGLVGYIVVLGSCTLVLFLVHRYVLEGKLWRIAKSQSKVTQSDASATEA